MQFILIQITDGATGNQAVVPDRRLLMEDNYQQPFSSDGLFSTFWKDAQFIDEGNRQHLTNEKQFTDDR